MARMSRTVKNVERTFLFQLTNGSSDEISTVNYIDMMQCHSLVNRIFARQGMNVMIESLEIGVQPGGAYTASVLRLPQHWACINAWTKSMEVWREQQNDTAREAGLESTIARYRDFKVFFDTDHADAGFASNLIPQGFSLNDTASTADAYEWDASQVVLPNAGGAGVTAERLLHMLGPDNGSTSAGLIHAYAQSRSCPFVVDPNIVNEPLGGLFGEMFDVGLDDEEIVDNFQDKNNEPPYLVYRGTADEAYPGGSYQGIGLYQASSGGLVPGQFVDTLSVNASQNYNTDQTGSFPAPCGLIKICVEASGVGISPGSVRPGEAVGGPLWCKVKLAPGYYQGIAALPMQEAN